MDKYREDVLKFLQYAETKDFFVFDTETTGLNKLSDDIIEFSALKCRKIDGAFQAVDEMDFFINPGYHIPEKITEINGITDNDVRDGLTKDEAYAKILSFWGENPVIVSYNGISFDEPFVNANLFIGTNHKSFSPSFHLDVMKMAKEKAPKPHKLINMAELAGVTEGLTFHRSIDDAKATLGVLNYLLPMYKVKEASVDESAFRVTAVRLWEKYGFKRIYISNSLNDSIFFEMSTAGEEHWEINSNVPDDVVKAKVYAFESISSDDELMRKAGVK